MKYLFYLPLLGALGLVASESRAQYGLYGSPELLQLAPLQSLPAPQEPSPGGPTMASLPLSPVSYDAVSSARPIAATVPSSSKDGGWLMPT
jgi:hypothetical protein